MKRFLWLGFVLCFYLICSGCGDTFRPIIIPNPPTFPNPKAAHTVVAINDNGLFVPGSAMVIDVSGDTDVSHANLDIAPVHAVQQTANEVLVVNQAVTGLNVPTTSCLVTFPPAPPNHVFNVCSSITKLNFSGTVIGGTNAISLPIYSGASFVAVAPSSTTAYVTMPTYPPDPTQPLNILPSVGVVNTQSNTTQTIPVGKNPVALAVTPNNGKLYVANQGDSTISGFDIVTLGLSQRVGSPMSASSPPIWLVARSDNQRVYVLEQNGTLAWLDTTSTAGPDTLTETTISVPRAINMLYDGNKNRLYIPGGTQLTILDVSQSAPQILAGGPIAIPTVAPSSRLASDPCSATSAQTLTVAAVAALPDGSRAYVGAYYEDTVNNINYICPQATVIDVASNTIKSSTPVPGFPAYDAFCSATRFRVTMAAGGDSSRAYLASCDGGMVNIIDTTSDTYVLNLPAPLGVRPGGQQNLPQNPVFLFAGP
jgi:DNA-binding beta-propeller fold protein YncE